MGGYIGTTWNSYELLEETLEFADHGREEDRLRQELADLLPEQVWCEKNAYGLNDQEHVYSSWRSFCEVIKYHRRFFFADYRANPGERDIDAPLEVLRKLFDYAESYERMVELPSGVQLFRARWQEHSGQYTLPTELGPPPRTKSTQTNRMSPPGIVVFYASEHLDTSLRETAVSPGHFVVGRFEATRPITVLDLTNVPPVPSLFCEISDRLEFWPRSILTFLNHIAEEIAKPIVRDDRVNIEYIPTQVITEYLRLRLTLNGRRIDGIRYSSSVHHGNSSYALFATQADLEGVLECHVSKLSYGREEKWLRLLCHSEHVVGEKDLRRWKIDERGRESEYGLV